MLLLLGAKSFPQCSVVSRFKWDFRGLKPLYFIRGFVHKRAAWQRFQLLHSLLVQLITAGMGFTNFGRYYSEIELLFCFVFPVRKLVHFMCYIFILWIANHLPESTSESHHTVFIPVFSYKHYLLKEQLKHEICCLCMPCLYTNGHFFCRACWIDVVYTPIITVPGTSSHFKAAVIHVTLAAERRTLDIPHCMTHSCLVKS